MTRYEASAIHLGICLLVAAVVLAVMLFVWYPDPYFTALGAGGLVVILLGVDVTIGPLITLVIWKTDQRRLKFDLTVIGLLQISALLYGLHMVLQTRPVYLVFAVDSFDVVRASDLNKQELKLAANSDYASLPLTGPRLVAANGPRDRAEQEKILFSALGGGADLAQMPRYYVPYGQLKDKIVPRVKSLDLLRKRHPEVDRYLAGLDAERSAQIGYLPVRAAKEPFTALVDKRTAEVVKLIPINPWG